MGKKTKKTEEEKHEEAVGNESNEPEVINPGDCIGHWLEGDKACEMCEIQDSCRDMTNAIQSKEEKSNGDKE
jgi:hypothetical protein